MPRNTSSSSRTVLCLLVLLGAAALFAPLAAAQPEGRGRESAPGQLEKQDRPAAARALGRSEDVRAVGRLVKAEARAKFVEPTENAQVLAREYHVTFDAATSPADVARVAQQLRAANTRVSYTGDGEAGWKGLAFSHAADEAPEATAALMDTLLAEPLVAHVSANSLLEIADGSARRMLRAGVRAKAPAPAPSPSPAPAPAPSPAPTCYASTFLSTTTATKTATTTNWGLDRIDSRANDAAARTPGTYQYRFATSGTGANIFVIDTGVKLDHPEFAGRIFTAYDVQGGSGTDTNGHGTHKAGIAAGLTVGVAGGASIHTARVMDAAGFIDATAVIAALNVAANSPLTRKIATLSLTGGFNAALNSAVDAAFNAGVLVVTASGNNAQDACNYSPGSSPSALTVAATSNTANDAVWASSNLGTCVSMFAPGDSIQSAWIGAAATNQNYGIISGTSNAAPFVAGVAARMWTKGACISAADCVAKIKCSATAGLVTGAIGATPNLLLSINPGI